MITSLSTAMADNCQVSACVLLKNTLHRVEPLLSSTPAFMVSNPFCQAHLVESHLSSTPAFMVLNPFCQAHLLHVTDVIKSVLDCLIRSTPGAALIAAQCANDFV